jgi:hypothetical protein
MVNPTPTIKKQKFRVKFKTKLNLVWGKSLENDKREAFAYKDGFPATVYFTDRRVFIIGEFVEKRSLFKKKSSNQYVYYEAGLQYIKDFKLDINTKVRSGLISFKPHGNIENGIIHFINLDPEMVNAIKKSINNVKNLKKQRIDTGIVVIGEDPYIILKKRSKI